MDCLGTWRYQCRKTLCMIASVAISPERRATSFATPGVLPPRPPSKAVASSYFRECPWPHLSHVRETNGPYATTEAAWSYSSRLCSRILRISRSDKTNVCLAWWPTTTLCAAVQHAMGIVLDNASFFSCQSETNPCNCDLSLLRPRSVDTENGTENGDHTTWETHLQTENHCKNVNAEQAEKCCSSGSPSRSRKETAVVRQQIGSESARSHRWTKTEHNFRRAHRLYP